jgi:hypothetical protein
MGQDLIVKLRQVLAELARPGAQKDDWFAWAAGQMAHAMIGAVLAGGLAFLVAPIWAFLAATLGYAAAKEVPDFRRAPSWAGARDSVQDSLFVASGAALALAIGGGHERLFIVAGLAAMIGLGLGIWARLARGGNG